MRCKKWGGVKRGKIIKKYTAVLTGEYRKSYIGNWTRTTFLRLSLNG